jgi:flagellar hook assembly protein FlgD
LKPAKVRVLESGERSAGRHEAVWDGRDASGKPAADGVYFYRLASGAAARTQRIVLLQR